MPKLQFKIEQVALYPRDPVRAMEFLTAMGAGEWAKDHVVASGRVNGVGNTNEADLAFDYEMLKGANELEVLHYTEGLHWMETHLPRVSHLGMHVTEHELHRWRLFMEEQGVREAQAVRTVSHTNPVIKGKRSYQYVIYDTYAILGVDIKFIVRIEK